MCSEMKNYLILTSLVLMCMVQFTQAAFLRCYNGSLDSYLATPLEKPLDLSPCLNTGVPTVVYTFGYRGKSSGPATTAVLKAYITKRKRNVILLDWENEAESGLLGIPLGYALYAVPNAKKIGRKLGEALMALTKAGVSMDDIHLVGHSLGAQIMAYAGKRTRENGQIIARITGLDPARALFEGTLAIQSGLDRTCARFVDILHTDPGGYGTSAATGTVDIWPNYSGNSGSQPGCPPGDFNMFSPEDLCSHDRSWRYYVEALGSPTALMAASATNVDEWVATNGQTNQTIYIGDLTSTRAKGNYYLRTNPEPAYGMGPEGMKPDGNQIRNRRNPILTRILKYLR
ncbi:unnamed protein product [Chrysodeixis includens]|uniref:Lipase domain-containing protein n=1 Tax=Chrysodeixis includens TaxID=689277 RepID=A0A9P0BHB3_CHRIL|nr:unnamed protein product [Chrysodeixis includens]